ncbi:hypothetical protein J8F10_18515 [Gemmata sp. G18]|uniref:Uncharacterized protein n=1 Tax=Gemmata palustris TaxID=2822762 RepID=A0ABS5BU55_9BACT|nr:hypothetical protein [Gemmata palustris]MBP3957258.1 hypothetical protein [Gemmata palustris]
MLAERLGDRAIARATGRSRSWVHNFVNALYREQTPDDPEPPPKSAPVVIEADELWNFAGSEDQVQ